MTEKTSLAPRDWVIAGLTALADGGVDAVRVERLAKVLGTVSEVQGVRWAKRR